MGTCNILVQVVILSWKELESLRVVSCKNVKDSEIPPSLSTLFSVFKELKWRPDTKSLRPSSLLGTGMGKKGGKFFKRM
jgi:F-box/leucine-rich repeat protein 2/20